MDGLAEAIAFVEAFCADRGVAASDGLRLSLVVEELFTNTVVHGHGGGSDAPVRIGLARRSVPSRAVVRGQRAAVRSRSTHVARSPVDPAAAVADRPIGHLGLALVVDMAERISYVRADGCNRVLLALRRQAALNTPADPA